MKFASAVWERVKPGFSDQEIADLTMPIVAINGWSRIATALLKPSRVNHAESRGPTKRRPDGDDVRAPAFKHRLNESGPPAQLAPSRCASGAATAALLA